MAILHINDPIPLEYGFAWQEPVSRLEQFAAVSGVEEEPDENQDGETRKKKPGRKKNDGRKTKKDGKKKTEETQKGKGKGKEKKKENKANKDQGKKVNKEKANKDQGKKVNKEKDKDKSSQVKAQAAKSKAQPKEKARRKNDRGDDCETPARRTAVQPELTSAPKRRKEKTDKVETPPTKKARSPKGEAVSFARRNNSAAHRPLAEWTAIKNAYRLSFLRWPTGLPTRTNSLRALWTKYPNRFFFQKLILLFRLKTVWAKSGLFCSWRAIWI